MLASVVALASCFTLKSLTAYSPRTRKLFSLFSGLLIHYYVFGLSGLASGVTNIFSYLAIVVLPKDTQHLAVFFVSGLGLSLAQIHKQIFHFGVNGLDVPMNLMFNFCRVTALACNIRDGQKVIAARKAGLEPNLKSRELRYAIEEIPSFSDYMSYLYFCGAAISGPFYEFKDFVQMIRQEGDFKKIPSTLKPGLTRFLHAWMMVAIGALLAQVVDEHFLVSEEFLNEYSLLAKIGYMYLVLKMMMSTYLVGWCLMEAGPIASGLGYNGVDSQTGEPRFDRVQSVNLVKIEVSTSVKSYLGNWNISVHNWLKNYIYLRMLPNRGTTK